MNARTRVVSREAQSEAERRTASAHRLDGGGVSEVEGTVPASVRVPRFLRQAGGAPIVQAKAEIQVGAADDALEREADAMADRVMGMSDVGGAVSQSTARVQRKCAACESEEEEMPVQRKADAARSGGVPVAGTMPAPLSVGEAVSSGGKPLEPGVRKAFESRFGRDFSSVRIHSDPAAEASASEIRARAYTSGRHIVFGSGEYSPGTNRGMRLLAHELTHVVQQAGGSVRRPSLVQRQPKDATPASPIGGCTESQSAALRKQLSLARALVGVAIAHLKKEQDQPPAPGISSVARRALASNFHTSDPKDVTAILATFKRILEKLKDSNIRCLDDKACDEVCAGAGAPFACASAAIPITVCEGVFGRTHSKEPFFYVVVLIHEAAHQVGMDLHTYEPPADGKLTARELAMSSANAYANFAEDCSVNGTGFYNFFRRK